MARLYEAARGFRSLDLTALVPADVPPLTEVIHVGQNNLPAFDRFQKRFCKPEGDGPVNELYGYNQQPWSWFSGPGYFVVRASTDEPGALDIDYHVVPKAKPATWPPIAENRGFGPTIVYGSMVDVLRGISAHVTIGRARRWGRMGTHGRWPKIISTLSGWRSFTTAAAMSSRRRAGWKTRILPMFRRLKGSSGCWARCSKKISSWACLARCSMCMKRWCACACG